MLRRREMAIRMAIGARSEQVLVMILRQSAALAAIGVVGGGLAVLGLASVLSSLLVGAADAARFMPQASRLLHGVSASDPTTLLFLAALLAAVAVFASYVPARRVAKVDPMVTLKAE